MRENYGALAAWQLADVGWSTLLGETLQYDTYRHSPRVNALELNPDLYGSYVRWPTPVQYVQCSVVSVQLCGCSNLRLYFAHNQVQVCHIFIQEWIERSTLRNVVHFKIKRLRSVETSADTQPMAQHHISEDPNPPQKSTRSLNVTPNYHALQYSLPLY